ncbi:MAG: secondary thiamine-phosphate synthase enzyme YjbQ [Thermoplasmata archaeon]
MSVKVKTGRLSINTKAEGHIVDITSEVQNEVYRSNIKNGIACVFVPGATAAITTIEYEPGLLQDFPDALERLFPKGIEYAHERAWHDGNGHSHVRASFLGPSLSVPIIDGSLSLGTWQQIVLVELDIRPRKREVIVQIVGE